MITVGMNYEVLEGKTTEFENGFRRVLAVMGETSGHVNSRLFRDIDQAGSYLIHSEWESKEAFTGFIRSQAFADVTQWGKEQILAGRPSHTIYGS